MLKNGLNIKKKPAPQAQATIKKPQMGSIFGQEVSDEEDQGRPPSQSLKQGQSSLKRAELDESDEVYDYDGVYDSMKSGDREAAKAKETDKRDRKPKYMQNLFEMAEVRKRDRLRAEDVKLQRERQAEGDEYADKEKFVTGAYRARQEELRKAEAEEAAKEAKIRAQGGGFSAFNQSILEKDRRKHEAAVQASLTADRVAIDSNEHASVQVGLEAERIKKVEAVLGHKVAVNDDNQIVDHRQLLGAGLNKPTTSAEHLQTANLKARARPAVDRADRDERQQQAERQQRQVDQQLRDLRKRQADEELAKQDAIREQAKRTKTDADVSSARDRYLARKKAEAEAKAKAEAGKEAVDT